MPASSRPLPLYTAGAGAVPATQVFETGDVDNDILISLVEARPVLWDKFLETFKDRNLTRDARREICCALKNGFDDLENNEKNAFGK
ncbi:hypothetical protein LSTR_LSTR017646 [Laodelphax striatellus]|uniref:Uncharacterized protein n=1 Tax=Laodelphax striatellus TaxID=195883 RepID=A0A482XAV0_LAOST|nr:hypothetical protein LSTR_LSTR017646 [Laodelphax striatellus]